MHIFFSQASDPIVFEQDCQSVALTNPTLHERLPAACRADQAMETVHVNDQSPARGMWVSGDIIGHSESFHCCLKSLEDSSDQLLTIRHNLIDFLV